MKRGPIYITQPDRERIEELIARRQSSGHNRDRGDLQELQEELQRAEVVPPQDIPDNVVTMNSKMVLRDLDTDENMTVSLVYPENADVDKGAISVLAPIGTALLGYRVGDKIEWDVPDGKRVFRIEKLIYQPEASAKPES